MSADDLIKEYKAGKRDFEYANLYGANLNGANLNHANLNGAELSGANLGGANLNSTYLGGVSLYGANLVSASLHGASLNCANLKDADLKDADLKDASLGRAYLNGADLKGANLSNANLEGADLSNADMEGAIVLLLNDVEYKATGLPLVRSMDKQSNELFIWPTDRGLVCLHGRRRFTDLKEAIKHWSSKDSEFREDDRDDAEIKVLLLKHALEKWGQSG